MNRKQLTWRIRYAWQYFPFTWNTALCAGAGWAAYRLLYSPTPRGEEPSPFLPFIILMGKMAVWFLAAIIALSVLSTFVSYLYYLYLRKSRGSVLRVEFTTETKPGKKTRLYLNARIDGAIRPILGFIKGRLFYDDHLFTDKFSLLSNKRKEQSLLRLAVTGRSRLSLPDIKEYDLKGGFIYFQDMLHIFSLTAAQPVSGHFYRPPELTERHDMDVFPKKTETMDVRIEQLRRVEGEQLNYKDFEAGDDVRRIVWKVYAKNRELVVRVPEMYEPYASHLYFYASFHASVKAGWMQEDYLKEMLNYYKNNVWTIYDTLSHKEWDMRYIPDQFFHVPEQLTDDEKAARIISNSTWHNDVSPGQYFNTRNGAVLCISSLTDPQELRNILSRSDSATIIYYVRLSGVFRHFAPLNWIGRLIFSPPEDRLARLRTSWSFSPVRYQVRSREKEIEDILRTTHVPSGII